MNKEWYKSKGIWAGLLGVVYGAFLFVSTGRVDFEAVLAFVTGLGILGIRDAVPDK